MLLDGGKLQGLIISNPFKKHGVAQPVRINLQKTG